MSHQKYGLEEIKIMVKLVSSKVSKQHIKLALQLAEYGINKDNVDGLYDILASDYYPSHHEHIPPSSQSRSESALVDFESPPSSQGYPTTICSDNETNKIDSPPYTDDDPWAGLPRDPNYVPKHNNYNNSTKSQNTNHNDTISTISSVTPTSNQHNTTASEKRTRDRFVFRSIHQEILNTAFFQNPYPENDEKEILVDKCNHALEGYKCRPLRENEKMTIFNITNWFNNRRKEKKRKWHQEITPVSIASTALVPAAIASSKHTKEDFNQVKEEVISEQEDDF